MKILRETTDWSDAGYNVPNHTYVLHQDKCLGRVLPGGVLERFHRPIKFDTRGRSFVEIKDQNILNFFKNNG